MEHLLQKTTSYWILRSALTDIASQYVIHSFRIGLAMTAAEKGINQGNGKMEKPGLPEL